MATTMSSRYMLSHEHENWDVDDNIVKEEFYKSIVYDLYSIDLHK
jgi:hypothetical protein